MGQIHDTSVRLQAFVGAIEQNIREAVTLVEPQLVEINADQLLNDQVDAEGRPTPEYSSKWKAKKGIENWNLYSSGKTQHSMTISTAKEQYKIYPTYKKNMEKIQSRGIDTERFFGIAPRNRDDARELTSTALGKLLKSKVFR